MAKLLTDKVKKLSASELSENRYDFLRLSEAEPDFGVPIANDGIMASLTDGTRKFLYFSDGLLVTGNNVTSDVTTTAIDTSTFSHSAANTLFTTLSDLDDAISSAVSGSLAAVSTDASISGSGTTGSPLSVVDDGHNHTTFLRNDANTAATGIVTFENDIKFVSPDGTNTITVRMLDSDTLTFNGESGQLFSISDDLTGTIFSVNDITGIPLIEADADATIRLGETAGNILIGTATDDGTNKLQVNGSVSISDTLSVADISVSANATVSGSLTVDGDLTVSGNTTYIDTVTLNVGDNIITLNADETNAPTQDAGIEVARGTANSVYLLWDETNDRWTIEGETLQVGAVNIEGYGAVINSAGEWVGDPDSVRGYTGSQGPIGYTGSQGVTGFTGSQGDIGYTGSQGPIGYTGSQGIQGVIGYTGSQGDQGDIGYTGSQGPIGYTGSQGEIGYTGSRGPIGYTGSQGIQGVIGYTGSQGIQGVIGYTGSQGIQGVIGYTGSQGIQGVIGYTGSQGDIGYTGSQGDQGVIGYTGSKGDQGVIGYTGSQGDQGIIGFTGSQGDIGYTGSQGDQGVIGYTGSQGIQGVIGYTGSQGIQGVIGYTGSQGIQGVIGYTGSQGDIGYTGSQGDIGYTGSRGPIGYTGSKGDIGYTGSQGPIGYTGSKGDIGYTGSQGPVAGTDGQVVYNNGGIAGGANLYYDDVNNRVGVKTASPSYDLDVVGSTNISGSLIVGGDLTVSGNTTVVNTTNLDVQDAVITLNTGQSTPSNDIGVLFQRYATADATNYNVGIAWEEGTDRLVFGKTPEDGADNDLTFSQEWMTITEAGDVGFGTTTPGSKVDVVGDIRVSSSVRLDSTGSLYEFTATTATITQTPIASWSATTFGGGKVVIEAKDGADRHITELLVTHDGTTAVATEYGSIQTSGVLANYEVDISGGDVRILSTAASTNSTAYKIMATILFS